MSTIDWKSTSFFLLLQRQVKDYNPLYNLKDICIAGQAAPAAVANDVYYYTGDVLATVFGVAAVTADSFMVYSTVWRAVTLSSVDKYFENENVDTFHDSDKITISTLYDNQLIGMDQGVHSALFFNRPPDSIVDFIPNTGSTPPTLSSIKNIIRATAINSAALFNWYISFLHMFSDWTCAFWLKKTDYIGGALRLHVSWALSLDVGNYSYVDIPHLSIVKGLTGVITSFGNYASWEIDETIGDWAHFTLKPISYDATSPTYNKVFILPYVTGGTAANIPYYIFHPILVYSNVAIDPLDPESPLIRKNIRIDKILPLENLNELINQKASKSDLDEVNVSPRIYQGFVNLVAGVELTILSSSFEPVLNLRPIQITVLLDGESKTVTWKYVLNGDNYDVKITSAVNLMNAEVVVFGKQLNVIPELSTDMVQWNSLSIPVTEGIAYAVDPEGVNVINKYKPERLHGSGYIDSISFHNKTTANINSVLFCVWRLDGVVYDLIHQVELIQKISAVNEIQTVYFDTPLKVVEGDFVGLSWTGVDGIEIAAVVDAPVSSTRVSLGVLTDNYDWDSKTGLANFTVIHALGKPPVLACIGDSIMEGAPNTSSMIAISEVPFAPLLNWQNKLYQLNSKFTYQNMGYGGQDTISIEARFDRDIVSKKPVFAVIDGGVNDLYGGISKAVFLQKWTSMLDKCLAGNIIPIVWKIMPWTNGSNLKMQERDDWKTSLAELFYSYNRINWIIIDWDTDLGQYRAGGDTGNLWDIKPQYVAIDDLGVHYNELGNAKIAEVMLREIKKKFRVTSPHIDDGFDALMRSFIYNHLT